MTIPEEPNVERIRENVRQNWTDQAAGWSKWHPQYMVMGRATTEALVQAAQLKPGMSVLDLAGGSGNPAIELATALGPDGHVTGTDLVPEMVAAAEENTRDQGLTNITFQQADAQALPFPDRSFDVVTSRHGVMFFVDIQQALQESRRVLKPGGRVVFTAFGPSERNPHNAIAQRILRKYTEGTPLDPGAPTQYRFAEHGTLSAELRQAGFDKVKEETRDVPWPWPGTPEQFWKARSEVNAQVRRARETLTSEKWEQATAEVLTAIAPYYDGECVNFTACIVVATGIG